MSNQPRNVPCLFSASRALFLCQQGLTLQAPFLIMLWVPESHQRQTILSHRLCHLGLLWISTCDQQSDKSLPLNISTLFTRAWSASSTRFIKVLVSKICKAAVQQSSCLLWNHTSDVAARADTRFGWGVVWSVSDQHSWCCLALLSRQDDYSSPTWICTNNALGKSGR